eukprot:jgi/Tetstr1/437000/TSEL_002739.t1
MVRPRTPGTAGAATMALPEMSCRHLARRHTSRRADIAFSHVKAAPRRPASAAMTAQMSTRRGAVPVVHASLLLPLLLALALALPDVGAAITADGGWSPITLPNPWKDPQACGRPAGVAHSWLCDPDHLVGARDQNLVEGVIKQIADGAPPFAGRECGALGNVGAQVAVAIVDAIRSDFLPQHSREAKAAAFARQLHDSWAVGHAECNDGVLLFLSISDRQVFISTGAGAKARLTDGRVGNIIAEIKPFLRASQYGKAVTIAVEGIGEMMAKNPSDDLWAAGLMLTVVAGFIGFITYKSRKSRHEYSAVKVHLNRIQEAQERAKHDVYQATSCPICLEDFTRPGTEAEEPSPSPIPEAGGAEVLPSAVGSSGIRSRTGSGASPSASAASAASHPGEERPLLGKQPEAAAPGAAAERSKPGSPAPGAKQSAAAAPVEREPVALPCGHVFCEPCIDEWMKQHRTCPICRKSPTGGGGGGGGGGGSGHDDNSDDDGQPRGPGPSVPPHAAPTGCAADLEAEQPAPAAGGYWTRWTPGRGMRRRMDVGPELAFRLGSLQRRYPRYVTRHMVDRWSYDIMHGRQFGWRTDPDFTRMDPARVERMQSSGARGASRSFGGGSSFGGGGRGGSW